MGVFDTVKRWFSNEAAEARDMLDGTRDRMEFDLDRREAELTASPSEKLEMIQDSIDEDDSFDAVRDKIEGRTATAEATTEVVDLDHQATDDVEVESPESGQSDDGDLVGDQAQTSQPVDDPEA